MNVKEIVVNRFISKSEIEGIDFVVNSYVGCSNACKYCYASFMSRLSGHKEEWGTFLDVKKTNYKLRKVSVLDKTYLMSSTTDCYNKYEEKYELTRNILKQLINFDFNLIIETKNALILRDIDLLKQINKVKIFISLNTLDDNFRKDMEKESPIVSRLETIKELKKNGFYVGLSIAPFFPFITNYQEIILKTKDYVDIYKFEFLKLKGEMKRDILKYISEKYNKYYFDYAKIYLLNDESYFQNLKKEIENFCQQEQVKYFFEKNS